MDHQRRARHILDTGKIIRQLPQKCRCIPGSNCCNFKSTWGIISSRFFIDPIWWMFVTWLPTFLKEQFAFDIKQVGAFAWVPYLFAAIGGLAGGFYSSILVKKRNGSCQSKKSGDHDWLCDHAGVIGCHRILYLDQLKEHVNIAIALISAALFGFQFLINNLQTLPADYFNGKNVGTVSGMGGTAAVAGTIILTFMVPLLTKTSYTTLFMLAALMVPVAWMCITFISSKKNKTKSLI